ncbi:MAG TPA: molybdopterin dinucleotide-binding protein, partial [Methanocorpusculum sp.]|nr:molybdopterin dinucleotide-binding protein [Methanocorpusculum sp.]
MTSITVNLISGRTIQQGVSMEAGKEKEDYMKSCGIIELDAADIAALGIWKNSNVRVSSEFGSVIVKAIET